jgi:HNH endonuclease
MTTSRHINKPAFAWTADLLQQLCSQYADTPTRAISDSLGCPMQVVYTKAKLLKLKKTPEFLSSAYSGRATTDTPVPNSANSRFVKGCCSWNKGIKMPGHGNASTFFKKGDPAINAQQVGALRINTMGDIDIKLALGKDKWYSLVRYTWELTHGPIPPLMCIGVRDHDRHNTQPDNLILLTRAENIVHNLLRRYPKELRNVMALRGRLNNQITKQLETQDV